MGKLITNHVSIFRCIIYILFIMRVFLDVLMFLSTKPVVHPTRLLINESVQKGGRERGNASVKDAIV